MGYVKISNDEVEETITVTQRVSLKELDEQIRMLEMEIADLTTELNKLKAKRTNIATVVSGG